MRKYIRAMLRAEGEHEHLKPSRYVKAAFEQIQQKKYGVEERRKNQAKGTHKKYLWKSRMIGLEVK